MEPAKNYTRVTLMELTTRELPSMYNTSDMSNSTEVTSKPHKDPMISFTVPASMFAAGVFGNVLAIVVLARSSREHKRTVFYRLVGALACTDLLGTCATSPVTLAVYANNFKWIGGMPLCNYESFMLIFASCSTIFIICTMAVDRFVSICHPFVYDKHVTTGKTKYGIMAVWMFAFVMGILPIIGLGENVIQFPGTWCFFTFTSTVLKNKIFPYFYAIVGLLGITITAISNFFVTSVLIKMRIRAAKIMASCRACSHRHSRETEMMVLMIGIVIIFATCWCPFLVRIIVNQAHHKQVNVKVDLMTLRLASLNQILDPWIYILFRKEMFSRGVKFCGNVLNLFCKKMRIERNLRKKSNDITNASLKTYGQESMINSLENNIDENEVLESEFSTISSKSQSERKKSMSKSAQNERSSLQKLLNQHNPQCFGLKHPACLFCFSNLPQAFALSLGTEQDINLEKVAAEADKVDSERV